MTESRLVVDIDEDLKIKLKIIALKQKKTMKEIITDLIKEYVDDYG